MGLLKTVGTVAVASAVHGRVQRRQQQRWAAQDQAAAAAAPPAPPAPAAPAAPPSQAAAAPPASPADMGERLGQLKQLGELLDAGILTEAEFQQQKARILNG
jgi:Short C-terminal domain